ncbi:serine hydrolase [Streptomyces johnsoniae]|uniref:Serine hydrolase n=1 Tax=Streptomyces johnsoniae TaxID=3075532 RepID=A0ABU2S290_9ACTN|nr:serine hydrolase [Streptomyces sp. DSM 41886]MDT0442893.1 serine hydrolase [Streptomyces sp. DSM 41886]
MSLSRRFRPALVVHTALATTLLAATAAGDSGSLPGQAEGVQRPDDSADWAGAGTDDRAVAPDRLSSGTSPSLLTPGAAPDALLAEAVDPLLVGMARVSVSVQPLDGGEGAAFGGELFDTASIVKVDILAALLLQAQDAGRTLTSVERARAEVMIEQSDNDATDALWLSIGGADGLDAANRRLGLTATTAGGGGHWGLTQTTSKDQMTLLRAIYGERSVLSTEARAYLRELMGGVVEGQRWGISAAADGGAFELKNGWLPRTGTERWDVNSIGRVTAGGREYLVAVVSDGHVSLEAGISVVEAAARAAVASVSEEAGRARQPGA